MSKIAIVECVTFITQLVRNYLMPVLDDILTDILRQKCEMTYWLTSPFAVNMLTNTSYAAKWVVTPTVF